MTKEKSLEKTKNYELLYLLSINLNPDEIKNIKQKINDIITKQNGLILKEEEIGKRKLAYIIKHARHAYYISTTFSLEPQQLSKIKHEIQLLPEIIRYDLGLKQDIQKPKTILEKPLPEKEKEKETKKVDIQELDRKIDELLSEHEV